MNNTQNRLSRTSNLHTTLSFTSRSAAAATAWPSSAALRPAHFPPAPRPARHPNPTEAGMIYQKRKALGDITAAALSGTHPYRSTGDDDGDASGKRQVRPMCLGFSLQPNLLTFALPSPTRTTRPLTARPLEHCQAQPHCPDSGRPPPRDPAFLLVGRHLPTQLCYRCCSKRTRPRRQGRQYRLPTPLLHSSLFLSPQHQH